MGQPEAMKALLDTHVLLWWHGDRGRLSREQRDVIAAAGADSPLEVSDISLWEVAMLYSLGRIRLTIPLREWLDKAVASLVPTPHPNLPRQSTQNQKTATQKIAPAGFSAAC